MGLLFKRRLSLFLVVVLAMSWLVIDQEISQKTKLNAEQALAQGNDQVIDASQLLGSNLLLAHNPIYEDLGFSKQGNQIVHRFRYYITNPQDFKNGSGQVLPKNVIYQLTLRRQEGTVVYGGCSDYTPELIRDRNGRSLQCDIKKPSTYNSFSFKPIKGRIGFGDALGHLTLESNKAEIYPLGFGTNTFLVVMNGQIYGYYEIADYDRNILRKRVPQGSARERVTYDYIASANGTERLKGGIASAAKLPPHILTSGSTNAVIDPATTLSSSDQIEQTKRGVVSLFGRVSFRNLTLEDNPKATDKVYPELPPIVTIDKGGTSRINDTVFQLVGARTVTGDFYGARFWGLNNFRVNNFFIFKLQNPRPEIATALVAPDLVYLLLDQAGTVSFLVEDKSKAGGIFAGQKDTLDELIALGSTSADRRDASSNTLGDPMKVPLEQYRAIITKRVYNEAAEPDAGKECGQVVNYKSFNTTYDNPQRFNKTIPDPAHSNCINFSSGGWLAEWKVDRAVLNEADPCQQLFEGAGFFAKFFIAKALCGVIHLFMSMTTWFALFAAEFLIEAVGLQ